LEPDALEELRGLISSSGQSSNVFMRNVITTEKLRQVGKSIPMAEGYLEQLQLHVTGIQEIYGQLATGLNAVIEAEKRSSAQHEKSYIRQLETEAARIKELSETIAADEERAREMKEQLSMAQRTIAEANARVAELQQANTAFSQLVDSQREESQRLSEQLQGVESIKQALAAGDELLQKMELEKARMEAAHKDTLLAQQAEHQRILAELQKEHAEQLCRVRNRKAAAAASK